jgi:anti-sigma factor RsiW
MSCNELVARLSDYLDGRLDEAARASFEAHLADCVDCGIVLDSTRSTILLFRVAGSATLAPERRTALVERLTLLCRSRSR